MYEQLSQNTVSDQILTACRPHRVVSGHHKIQIYKYWAQGTGAQTKNMGIQNSTEH